MASLPGSPRSTGGRDFPRRMRLIAHIDRDVFSAVVEEERSHPQPGDRPVVVAAEIRLVGVRVEELRPEVGPGATRPALATEASRCG